MQNRISLLFRNNVLWILVKLLLLGLGGSWALSCSWTLDVHLPWGGEPQKSILVVAMITITINIVFITMNTIITIITNSIINEIGHWKAHKIFWM